MEISTRYMHLTTYKTIFGGFYVDIVLDTKEQRFDSVLYHEKYGIREVMFGVKQSDVLVEEFIEMVESNLGNYIDMFIESRENEDGHEWRY